MRILHLTFEFHFAGGCTGAYPISDFWEGALPARSKYFENLEINIGNLKINEVEVSFQKKFAKNLKKILLTLFNYVLT